MTIAMHCAKKVKSPNKARIVTANKQLICTKQSTINSEVNLPHLDKRMGDMSLTYSGWNLLLCKAKWHKEKEIKGGKVEVVGKASHTALHLMN